MDDEINPQRELEGKDLRAFEEILRLKTELKIKTDCLNRIKAKIEEVLSPDKDGGIYGYNGKFHEWNRTELNKYSHDVWSSTHDYQHMVIDIYEVMNI